MKIGKLRNRVEIQIPIQARTADGGYSHTWANKITLWAEMTPLAGTELEIARQVNALVTHRIRTRYVEGVTASMRLVNNNKTFNIEFVQNMETRDRSMEIFVTELATEDGA